MRRRKVFWASSRTAAVHLSAISACLQRLTLRVTWRTVHAAQFSTMLSAGERAPEFVRQAEADDGEDLLQPLQDAARDARFLMLQTPDQVAQEPLGLEGAVLQLVPGLTERLLEARVQMLGQALDDVTALVDLAAQDDLGPHRRCCGSPALLSAFAPSTMNSRDSVESSPLVAGDLSLKAWTTTVFSVAPSTTARTCFVAVAIDAENGRAIIPH